jgi:hypothetical protein
MVPAGVFRWGQPPHLYDAGCFAEQEDVQVMVRSTGYGPTKTVN